MKRTLLSIVTLFTIALQCFSQNCDLTPEANKYKIRGEVFLELAKNKDDYKLVADEWEKAIALAPDCSELLYNIAVVYGEVGDFEKATNYVKKHSEINQSEDGKKDATDLLIRLEARKEIIKNQAQREKEKNDKLKLENTYFGTWKGDGYTLLIKEDGIIHLWSENVGAQGKGDFKDGEVFVSSISKWGNRSYRSYWITIRKITSNKAQISISYSENIEVNAYERSDRYSSKSYKAIVNRE